MNTSAIALSGLNVATLRQDASANNIANSQTPAYRRELVAPRTLADGGVQADIMRADVPGESLADDIVGQMSASYAYKANLKVLQTQDRMLGALLDLRA